MAKIKRSSADNAHQLTEREFNYIKILNLALQYSVLKDKAISGFLYYICHSRFGYRDDDNLIFEIDLENDAMELKVKKVPIEDLEAAKSRLRQDSE